jgi:xanthine dehydrogenase small subunit
MSTGQSRDFIFLYVNGREHKVKDSQAFMTLADWLRYAQGLCGTKIVCAEGDCGACSVLVGSTTPAASSADSTGSTGFTYRPINACIQKMYQLDLRHVVTVEGLTPEAGLSPVQQAMVDCHGAQCGYCTPGFVVALSAFFNDRKSVCRQSVKDALTGNLCRCTGYESIIASAIACEQDKVQSLEERYPSPPMAEKFDALRSQPVRIDLEADLEGTSVFIPHNLEAAVQFKRSHTSVVIISGGTDVCVNMNKRDFRPRYVMSTGNLHGLDELKITKDEIIVGCRVTLETLADGLRSVVPEFYDILYVFGAPQIRYAGTLAGNIANGSPIADTLPFLFVMEAEVEVTGTHGQRRIPICSLYTGYKTLDMNPDEIITRIFIPRPKDGEHLRLYKISKREQLDISSFACAFLIAEESAKTSRTGTEPSTTGSSFSIKYARVSFGGVAPVVLRMTETESFLQGKPATMATFEAASEIALKQIAPISDVRGSSDFRNQLARNIFLKLSHSL